MNDKYKFDLKSFGMRLKEMREFHEMTQAEVAETLDISEKSIQNWENGIKLPTIDNIVNIAACYGMSVGEILEDESYRIFLKKRTSRKRSIEIIEVPGKIEVFFEITEDRYFDRYEVWVWDEIAKYKYMYMSVQKLITFDEIRDTIINQADEIVEEYRGWLFKVLTDNEEDNLIRSQIEYKIKCEKAGMASPGAVCAGTRIWYFENEDD